MFFKKKKIWFCLFVLILCLIAGEIFAAEISTARAYSVGSQNTSHAIWTKVVFGAEEWDTQNEFSDSKFTALEAGKYLVISTICFDSAVAGVQLQDAVYINAGVVRMLRQTLSSATYQVVNTSWIVNIVANDYIEIYVRQNSGVDMLIGNSVMNHVEIYKLDASVINNYGYDSNVATFLDELNSSITLFAGIVIFFISFILLIWYFKPRFL